MHLFRLPHSLPPNVYLSYISEAAASLLDERLSLNIVPRTQLVSISSQVSINHSWDDPEIHMLSGILL